MRLTTKEFVWLFIGVVFTLLINAGIQKVAPGLTLAAWTPVWAAYALWQYVLRRERTRMPRSDRFDEEYRTLLEKEGQK